MNKSRKEFILSADDFGLSPLANKNILALIRSHKLDRASLMVDGTFTPKELEELKASGIRIDIHLDLSGSKKKRKKIKENALIRGFVFLLRLTSRSTWPNSVRMDWESQIEKFHSLVGRYPDGLNSHQHIHFFPLYFKVAILLAQKNRIAYFRFGKDTLIQSHTLVYYILFFLHKKNRKNFLSSKLQTSAHLVSLDWIDDMPKFMAKSYAGPVEIVCHPEIRKEFEAVKKYF